MRKMIIVWIQVLFLLSPILAQEKESLGNFVTRSEGYYQYIVTPSVKNFSCRLTTHFYINFMKSQSIEEKFNYPIKFVWTNEGRRYYVLEPLPELSDSLRRQALQYSQMIKNLFESIVLDLQKMSFRSPLYDIPLAASMSASQDTVNIEYSFESNSSTVSTIEKYTPSGQFFKFIWQFGTQKVINYPKFETVKGKWICNGWESQVYNDKNEIVSGVATRLIYNRNFESKARYLPEKIDVIAQTVEDPAKGPQTNSVAIYLKGFTFNEDVTVLENETAKNSNPTSQ